MAMQQNENDLNDFMPNPLQPSGPLMGPGWLVEDEVVPRPRTIRIIFTDTDATDSSSDEDERSTNPSNTKRVKTFVHEIKLNEASSNAAPEVNSFCNGELTKKKKNCRIGRKEEWDAERKEGVKKKYRGVRQRKWGNWCAEIRDRMSKKRFWLGTYKTTEEAAMKYDQAAIMLHGPKAITNFRCPSPPERVGNASSSVLNPVEEELREVQEGGST